MMKPIILLWTILLSFPAMAVPSGAAKTVCRGVVKTPTSAASPIKIEIEWGAQDANSQPETLSAQVTISVDGLSGTEITEFAKTGGATRCENWTQARAMVYLERGVYAYYLDIDHSWNSGCGSHLNGTYLSDTLPSGPNKLVKLECE